MYWLKRETSGKIWSLVIDRSSHYFEKGKKFGQTLYNLHKCVINIKSWINFTLIEIYNVQYDNVPNHTNFNLWVADKCLKYPYNHHFLNWKKKKKKQFTTEITNVSLQNC